MFQELGTKPSDCPVYPLHFMDLRSDPAPACCLVNEHLPCPGRHHAHPQAAGVQLCAFQAPLSSERADLTAEMISAPLGDFRHTMHVGWVGGAFGDTSFLNSKADPSIVPKASCGLKHAESIMSFHIDLGPSMLGDVLSIMDKVATPIGRQESKASSDQASMLSPHALEDDRWAAAAPSPSSASSVSSHTIWDNSSLSSCTSGVLEECSRAFRGPDRARIAAPRQPDEEFSFMDEEEEEDEIRV
ncbi:Cdc42 effector protein 4 [Cricetulus griseus]|uniref:Cdc42 effector protein 4 n=1 Tax=Cricetulus griseus TaxID=10029 RepID=G3IAG3_CRIGR|nr:Cdc42 effector protein 4 [Cricetulus griseus]